MEDGEFFLRGIAAHDQCVACFRDTRDLQLEIVLVRPEPGHFVISNGLIQDRKRRRFALAQGVWHRLQSKPAAVERARVVAAVTHGVDVGIGGAGERIDDNSVLGREPGRLRELHIGRDADSDNHDVGLEGADTVYVAATASRFIFQLYGDPALKSVADLKGRVIVVTQPAASTDYTIDDIATRDWPAAIAKVREVSGADSVQVVPHCVGSMSFLMALAAGMQGVRSALCSQLGLHPVPVLLNRAKAQARLAALMHGVGIERLTTTFNSAAFEDRALEQVMRHWPTREKCDSEVCHRILFVYGEVFDHDRLNEATHDAIVHIFGKTRLTAFRHLSQMIREGHAVGAGGEEAYLPHLDRLAIPITFVHGEHNRMFIPRSTELTYDALRAANGDALYRRVVVKDYAHMDCWIGEHAAHDVFPLALAELDRFN